ncbi:peptidoglycan DD-metalloendopeptidase family protein [Exilibacterium tricleocarpae]|uniref:Peptidoglycan DD-metalloendopeptidase family protein n=1 Tax=Exilibacterium tricleocarpae TaxID=2591008 RepID=A0A545SLY6_9GAMM|nr:peptidoglycan DD-metalloendopeptidase family protein [Exilibacterium tricleocarpae]TQV65993.1 peptidoglycan DD-metalloendopeptidase family protein [Exilibacterium tricleocarpae]
MKKIVQQQVLRAFHRATAKLTTAGRRYLVLAVALLCASTALAQQISETEYQTKLKSLQDAIEQLQRELRSVKDSRDELQNNLQQSETDIGELIKKIERIKGELKEQDAQLHQLNDQRDQLRGDQRQQQHQIAQQVNASYRLGRQGNLKLLLNQEDPARVARMLKYYDYFLDARADKIDTYLDTIAELNQIEPRIKDKTEQLAKQRNTLEQRHRQLTDRQTERQRTLAKLNATITDKDANLKKLARDRAELEQVLRQVTDTLAGLSLPGQDTPFASLRGKLAWPARGRLAHTFGSTRAAGKMKWDGVMIRASAGTAVAAIHHGRVVFSDYLRGHGLLLIIDHGGDYMSLYAHNQALYKDTGDWVEAGETIANVGASGGLTRAGLYFEIRHRGKPTNPANWCRG